VGAYYYFIAQLPYLVYGQNPPMSSLAFKEFAKASIDKGDAQLLDSISLDPQPLQPNDEGAVTIAYAEKAPASGSVFIDNWRDWERTLRLHLAKQRAVKLKRENTVKVPMELPVFPTDAVAAAAKTISAVESPLELEILLDKARWSAIEEFQGTDHFSSNTIFAYFLKLLLLERRALFKTEEGNDEYNSLYASILEGVQPGISPVGESK